MRPGRLVPNPISLVSQWKIFDNLRRSLVEPATLLLFVLGWLVLPGSPARIGRLPQLCILFVPVWFEFLFTLVRSAAEKKLVVAREAVAGLITSNVSVLLSLTFLLHQTLVSLDAVVRTLIRRWFTQQRLLEWETAAEAEAGAQQANPGGHLPELDAANRDSSRRDRVFLAARWRLTRHLPILVLWACSKAVSMWLNHAAAAVAQRGVRQRQTVLATAALRTWRYFAEFSNEQHNWLIPDNVQEEPFALRREFLQRMWVCS